MFNIFGERIERPTWGPTWEMTEPEEKENPTPEESLMTILKELNKHGLDTQKRLLRTITAFVVNA